MGWDGEGGGGSERMSLYLRHCLSTLKQVLVACRPVHWPLHQHHWPHLEVHYRLEVGDPESQEQVSPVLT